ncbi:TetR/AcrR family transcriptional regulator ['Paenibacillus yunnanensis' Narsing Rao et al. 2020]|uniref:TetR/AcrR family transcriptional regulator n=1 Tax=Paenibacillus tengchongensis TaxID=2608684 RepID=UPI00124F47E2|nr:TetR/AcrR family transcriptional regulator [Paenibacillus tengchongensis]
MTTAPVQDRRIHKSKAALKEALIHLLQQKEFRMISITDIVQEADLNRGTFYKHYQYKEELLEDISRDVLADLIHSYREPYEGSDTFEIGKMGASGIKIFDHVQRHAYFYTLSIRSSALAAFREQMILVLKKLSLQDLGDSPRRPEQLDRGLLAGYHAYAILGMIMEWVNDGFRHSPAYMAEQLAQIVQLDTTDVIIRPHIAELRG